MTQTVPTSEALEQVLNLLAQARAGLRNLAAEATTQARYRADERAVARIDQYATSVSQALKSSERELGDWQTIVEALSRRGRPISIIEALDNRIGELVALRDKLANSQD